MAPPKSTGHMSSRRAPKLSRPIQETTPFTGTDIQGDFHSRCSFPAATQHLPINEHPVTRWIAQSDHIPCHDTNPPQLRRTPCGNSLVNAGFSSTSETPWDHATAMKNLILSPRQVLPHDYQHSESSGSLGCGSDLVIDPLVIDPSISAPHATHQGSQGLPMGAGDLFVANDLVSGSFSYDGSNASNLSPSLSPELDDQAWSAQPSGHDTSSQNVAYTMMTAGYSHLSSSSQKQFWPPSPPTSDMGVYACLGPNGTSMAEGYSSLTDSQLQGRPSRSMDTPSDYRDTELNVSNSPIGIPGANVVRTGRSSRPTQRMLKPASEKPRGHDQGLYANPLSGPSKLKEKPESSQPRNHHLYKVSPGKDGLFRCPFAKETQCAHAPTKQKCGYDKYLDSHLKPYHCKFGGCQELKFSSNACLFRHEREAHGMHFYGKNPHRCHFAGCDRSIEGFPRRWNLHDHMRRVHKYDAARAMDLRNQEPSSEIPNKRKGAAGPSSCHMKRTSSSQAKARAASSSYSRERPTGSDPGYQDIEKPVRNMTYTDYNLDMCPRQTLAPSNRSICATQHVPLVDAEPRISYGFSYL